MAYRPVLILSKKCGGCPLLTPALPATRLKPTSSSAWNNACWGGFAPVAPAAAPWPSRGITVTRPSPPLPPGRSGRTDHAAFMPRAPTRVLPYTDCLLQDDRALTSTHGRCAGRRPRLPLALLLRRIKRHRSAAPCAAAPRSRQRAGAGDAGHTAAGEPARQPQFLCKPCAKRPRGSTSVVQNCQSPPHAARCWAADVRTLYGPGKMYRIRCAGCNSPFRSRSFYQVNPEQTEVLYAQGH